MVALVIISFGLLGVAGLQLVAIKGTDHAFQQSQASNLVQGLLERMRANPKAVHAGHYNIADSKIIKCNLPLSKNCEDGNTSCSSDELATSDVYHTVCGYGSSKQDGIRSTLLNGSLSVACIAGVGTCNQGINFSVKWNERSLGAGEQDGDNLIPREITLNTMISE